MRERRAGRMPSLTGWMLVGFLVASGCRTTSPPSKSLTRIPNADPGATITAANQAPAPGEISWKKSPTALSAATAPETWTNPLKQDDPVRATTFQEPSSPKQDWMPPIPDMMVQDDVHPPLVVHTQPNSPRRGANVQVGRIANPSYVGAKYHGASPMPVPNAPNEWNPVTLPSYVIRPPDVLLIELLPQFSRDEDQKLKLKNIGLLNQPIFGQHLVRPDGTVELGVYGSVPIAGRTIAEARDEVVKAIRSRLRAEITAKDISDYLKVDILSYNSSVYYVITDGAGLGQQVYRFPVTGHETVLDAIANVNGLPVVASPRRIWVARKNPGDFGPESKLQVDWKGISEFGAANTNWQLMPGDRVFVQSDPMRRFNNTLGKMLEPIERLMGVTLLSSQTVNTIKNGTTVTR
jgi:polysaccharide biosynthesis/export protein